MKRKRKIKMFKSQMKFQKILTLVLLLFAAVCFVFSVGITTDLYGLYLASAITYFDGIELFKDIQPYNNTAVALSIVLVLTCLLPYIFATNKRRLYYLDNYISSGVQGAFFGFYGVYVLINNIVYRTRFVAKTDFVSYKEAAEMFKFKYSESTFFFDVEIVLSILCLVAVVLIALNVVWKIRLMKKEKEILALGAQHD